MHSGQAVREALQMNEHPAAELWQAASLDVLPRVSAF